MATQEIVPSVILPFNQSQLPHLMSSTNSSLPVSVCLPVTLPSLGCQSLSQLVTVSNVCSQKHLWNESLPLEEIFLILSQLFGEIMQENMTLKYLLVFLS